MIFARLRRHGRLVASIAIGLVLLWVTLERLSAAGWKEVLHSLPHSSAFYLVGIMLYAVLPFSEIAIYSRLWNRNLAGSWPFFVLKQALNFGLLSYSGEPLLLFQARTTWDIPLRKAAGAIKDNNILSALISNTATLLIAAIVLAERRIASLPGWLTHALLAGGIGLAVLTLTGWLLRRRIFGIADRDLRALIAIHSGRLLVFGILQILQWSLALPAFGVELWAELLALQFLVSRLPLLPNKDLAFLAATVWLLPAAENMHTAIDATILASVFLTQMLHVAVAVAASASSLLGRPWVPARRPSA